MAKRKVNLLLWPLGISLSVFASTGALGIGARIAAESALTPVVDTLGFTVAEIMGKIAGPTAMGLGLLFFAVSLFAYCKHALPAKQTRAPAPEVTEVPLVELKPAEPHPVLETADIDPKRAYWARIGMILCSTVVAAGIGLTIAGNIGPIAADMAHNLTITAGVFVGLALVFTIIDLVANRNPAEQGYERIR